MSCSAVRSMPACLMDCRACPMQSNAHLGTLSTAQQRIAAPKHERGPKEHSDSRCVHVAQAPHGGGAVGARGGGVSAPVVQRIPLCTRCGCCSEHLCGHRRHRSTACMASAVNQVCAYTHFVQLQPVMYQVCGQGAKFLKRAATIP